MIYCYRCPCGAQLRAREQTFSSCDACRRVRFYFGRDGGFLETEPTAYDNDTAYYTFRPIRVVPL